MKDKYLIYLARNIVNGKCYVGQTAQTLSKRRNQHINNAGNGSTMMFHEAIRKYGIDNFEWEILDSCSDSKIVDSLESLYIAKYDTFGENGYNATINGQGSGRIKRNPPLRNVNSKDTYELAAISVLKKKNKGLTANQINKEILSDYTVKRINVTPKRIAQLLRQNKDVKITHKKKGNIYELF